MHVGRSYRLVDFAWWSRRSAIYMLAVSLIAFAAYTLPPVQGFAVPWAIVLVLGTTVSLVAGFKISQVLQRSSEALQCFAQIAASSRMLASLCCDFLEPAVARRIINRHLAWLTALRFTLRRPKPWESTSRGANREFRRRFMQIQEDITTLPAELERLIGADAKEIAAQVQPTLAVLQRQAEDMNGLLKQNAVPSQIYGELLKVLRDCHEQQTKCERIKNSPYPRQYAIVSAIFVAVFATMLPFGVVPMFAQLSGVGGVLGPYMVWLSIPFSVLLGWIYFSLDLVGESTSNPFEGNANDVPISQICRDLEIELRGQLGDTDLPPPLAPQHGIAT
jgi:putative membrane protein